jgi:hypothetical protein
MTDEQIAAALREIDRCRIMNELERLRAENQWMKAIDATIKAVVDEQANDESLWFIPETITEDILQRALRRLHEVIEGKTSTERAIEVLIQTAALKDRR